jgi:hypothetical protein
VFSVFGMGRMMLRGTCLLSCQNAVGVCRPTFFINSVVDFSTGTTKGMWDSFFSVLCFFTFDRVDSIIFYSAMFLFLLLLFACEFDFFG